MNLPADTTTSRPPAFARRGAGVAPKAFYAARTPMLLLDDDGVVVGVNAAARELFGLDVAGCMGWHFAYLEERLRARVEGSVFPADGTANAHFRPGDGAARAGQELVLETEDLRVAVADCRYQSARFGLVRLRVAEVPCVDTSSGACAGSAVSLEVVDMADPAAFRQALDRHLGDEVMWEVYAASYDRILPEMPFYQEVWERHCAAMAPDPIHTVLDVGAGTGLVAVPLLRRGKRVTAVDVGRAMLARLYAKVEAEHADRLTVVEDTAERLPHLADDSFDGVTVLLAFFAMEGPAAALAEAQRVLKPGGTLIVTEPRACFDVGRLMTAGEASLRAKGLFERLARDWRRIQTVAPRVRDTIEQTQRRAAATPTSKGWHAEAIRDALERDGFTDLTFRESHLGSCATITGVKPSARAVRGESA